MQRGVAAHSCVPIFCLSSPPPPPRHAPAQMACQEALGAGAPPIARAALTQLHALLVSKAPPARASSDNNNADAPADPPQEGADKDRDGGHTPRPQLLPEATVLRCLVRLELDEVAAATAGGGGGAAAAGSSEPAAGGEPTAGIDPAAAGGKGGAGGGGEDPLKAALGRLGQWLHLALQRCEALGLTAFVGAGEGGARGGEQLAWFAAAAWNGGLDAAGALLPRACACCGCSTPAERQQLHAHAAVQQCTHLTPSVPHTTLYVTDAREFQSAAVLMNAAGALLGLLPDPEPRHLRQQRMAFLVAASAALEVRCAHRRCGCSQLCCPQAHVPQPLPPSSLTLCPRCSRRVAAAAASWQSPPSPSRGAWSSRAAPPRTGSLPPRRAPRAATRPSQTAAAQHPTAAAAAWRRWEGWRWGRGTWWGVGAPRTCLPRNRTPQGGTTVTPPSRQVFTLLQEFGIAARLRDAPALEAALGRAGACGAVGAEHLLKMAAVVGDPEFRWVRGHEWAPRVGGHTRSAHHILALHARPPRSQPAVAMAALRAALTRLMGVSAPNAGRVALVVRQMVGAAGGDDARLRVFRWGARRALPLLSAPPR